METYFDPNNSIVKLCIKGMGAFDLGQTNVANELFLQAWSESTNDFERCIASFCLAKHLVRPKDKLMWLEKSLEFARNLCDIVRNGVLSSIHLQISKCYEELFEADQAKRHYDQSNVYQQPPTDVGPFYHGTRADLCIGDLLIPGGESNYEPNLKMNHIYFTSLKNGASLAAALAKGDGTERVYIVEPIGSFENDPNVTDKKFPGNLTRSYRSQEPLKIVGEEVDWKKQSSEDVTEWREKLATNKGAIIN